MSDLIDGWPTDRVRELLRAEVVDLQPVGGVGFGSGFAGRLADGRRVFIKGDLNAAPSFFTHEAWGLRWLGEVTGGARAAEVLAFDHDLLVLEWLATRSATPDAATEFGRRLAVTHDAGAPTFGRDVDSVLASQTLPGGEYDDWPSFYAEARLRPFLDRAVTAGSIADRDRRAIEQVIDRLPELAGPAEPPARLHGDLWSGNVLWTDRGAVLIDPACYGGHRETDLAMLSLFGLPHLDRALDGYQAQHPLADGWQERVRLHQLFPLLVHAVIFGGGYGAAAGDAARESLH